MSKSSIAKNDVRITLALAATVFGFTGRTGRRWAEHPEFPRKGEDGLYSLTDIISHRLTLMRREGSGTPAEQLALARTRLAHSQADVSEYRRLEEIGQLVRRDTLDEAQRQAMEIQKSDLLHSTPTRLAGLLADRKSNHMTCRQIITEHMRGVLNHWFDLTTAKKTETEGETDAGQASDG